jgi:hypothetical protein
MFFKLRSDAVFRESTLYDQALQRLPAHLQPFAKYPPLQNQEHLKEHGNNIEQPCTSASTINDGPAAKRRKLFLQPIT